ncbi:hypothetical protein GF312_18510 [Candidatus Poribacteria bacterium]|nr:hypothetical protein [Candidatus Poribacteria bacterium]
MRRFSYFALSIMLPLMVIYICSCVGTGGIADPGDPIFPAPDLEEGTVDPITRAITITKEGITVTVEHWSRRRLNRKYTSIDMRSPFYYLETWEQSFKAEVFHVTITNNTPRGVVVNFERSILEDEREYIYQPLREDYYRYKFVTKKMMDLRTKRGLEIVPQITLEGVLGESAVVPAGQTKEGFLPFTIPNPHAEKVWLTINLEKEPELATQSYEPVEFKFNFIQDPILLSKQPPMRR